MFSTYFAVVINLQWFHKMSIHAGPWSIDYIHDTLLVINQSSTVSAAYHQNNDCYNVMFNVELFWVSFVMLCIVMWVIIWKLKVAQSLWWKFDIHDGNQIHISIYIYINLYIYNTSFCYSYVIQVLHTVAQKYWENKSFFSR